MILKLINWLHDTFGIGKDAVAGLLVTIFTFSVGILITVLFKAIEGYFERRSHRKLLKINIINLIKGIYKQAIAYQYLSKEISIEHSGAFGFVQKSISAVSLFNQLGYRNLYNSHFTGFENIRFRNRNKKQIAFNNIWATLEYLRVFHERSFEETNQFIELNLECNEARNKALGEVHIIVENIRITLHGERGEQALADYFNAIENIYITLKSKENYTNAQITQDFVVKPLLNLNRKNVNLIKKYAQLLRPVELNHFLLEASLRYENQKNLMETYSLYFKELASSFYWNCAEMKKSYRVLGRCC